MTAEATTETPRFSVGAAAYVKAAARRRLWRIIWLPAILLVAAAIAGAYDSRWWYVGLMLLFIVYPMVLSLTWLAMAAHPSMRWLLRPQQWSVSPGGIDIVFFGYDDDSPAVGSLALDSSMLGTPEHHGPYWQIDTPTHPHKIDFLLIPTELVPAENLPQTEI